MQNLMTNFSGLALSRIEMKNVTGGCGYSCGGGVWHYNVSKAYAKGSNGMGACASWGGHGSWCCASC
jgi:hypothetical protein